MRGRSTVFALIGALLIAGDAHGHSGGLDGYGCHRNKKAGGYHCHRGPYKGMEFGSKEEALRFFEGGGSSGGGSAAAPLLSAPGEAAGSVADQAARIEAAQKMLAALGYYHGAADGKMGPATRAAVIAYQKSHGLQATGEVTDDLLSKMTLDLSGIQ
jgi:hypothetical protein